MEFIDREKGILERQKRCGRCHQTYDEPKIVQYFVCPHCLEKIEEEQVSGCQHWFGYLNQKEESETIPKTCIECERVVECMLTRDNSPSALAAIKKWY